MKISRLFVKTFDGEEVLGLFYGSKSIARSRKDWEELNPDIKFFVEVEVTSEPTEMLYIKPSRLAGSKYKRRDIHSRLSPVVARGSIGEFLLDEDTGACCIYAIRCKATGRVYVGKTKNLSARAKSHFSRLNRGSHVNHLLQEDWKRFTPAGFRMEVLAVCNEGDLASLEAHHIQSISTNRSYNILGAKPKDG